MKKEFIKVTGACMFMTAGIILGLYDTVWSYIIPIILCVIGYACIEYYAKNYNK